MTTVRWTDDRCLLLSARDSDADAEALDRRQQLVLLVPQMREEQVGEPLYYPLDLAQPRLVLDHRDQRPVDVLEHRRDHLVVLAKTLENRHQRLVPIPEVGKQLLVFERVVDADDAAVGRAER